MRASNTVLDGTFNLWATPAPGPTAADSAAARATTDTYLRLIRRLHDAGVTLVPGTDNSAGTTFHSELELYERAGIPAPTVLQMATIVSARVMKDDREYGSLAPGKVADLVIVDGRPADRVADLRKVDRVMRAGRVYTPAELRQAMSAPQP
jgi:imidazolonepropionase-like amidohydrolase